MTINKNSALKFTRSIFSYRNKCSTPRLQHSRVSCEQDFHYHWFCCKSCFCLQYRNVARDSGRYTKFHVKAMQWHNMFQSWNSIKYVTFPFSRLDFADLKLQNARTLLYDNLHLQQANGFFMYYRSLMRWEWILLYHGEVNEMETMETDSK